jgi:hypothetical protein
MRRPKWPKKIPANNTPATGPRCLSSRVHAQAKVAKKDSGEQHTGDRAEGESENTYFTDHITQAQDDEYGQYRAQVKCPQEPLKQAIEILWHIILASWCLAM